MVLAVVGTWGQPDKTATADRPGAFPAGGRDTLVVGIDPPAQPGAVSRAVPQRRRRSVVLAPRHGIEVPPGCPCDARREPPAGAGRAGRRESLGRELTIMRDADAVIGACDVQGTREIVHGIEQSEA